MDGQPDDRVLFTSNSSTPVPGVWGQVKFNTTSDNTSYINYADIEYASYGIYLDGSNANITGCGITNSSGYGLRAESSGPKVDGCAIEYNERGVLASASDFTISNGSISHSNFDGLVLFVL